MINFSYRSAAKHGKIKANWLAFSSENSISNPEVPSLLGHRWNIVFYLSERLLNIRTGLIAFLEQQRLHIGKTDILADMYQLLTDPIAFNQLRTLAAMNIGVISVLTTLVHSSKDIIQFSDSIQQMLSWVERVIEYPELLMDPFSHPFYGQLEGDNTENFASYEKG